MNSVICRCVHYHKDIAEYHIHQWNSTMSMSAATAGWKGIKPRYEWVSLKDTKTCGLHTALPCTIHTVLYILYWTACTIYSIYYLLCAFVYYTQNTGAYMITYNGKQGLRLLYFYIAIWIILSGIVSLTVFHSNAYVEVYSIQVVGQRSAAQNIYVCVFTFCHLQIFVLQPEICRRCICIYNRIVTLQLNSATLSKQTPFLWLFPGKRRCLFPWARSVRRPQWSGCTALPDLLAVIGGHKLKPFRPLLLQCLCAPGRLHWGKNTVNFLSFRKIIVAILKERKWNPEIVLS